LIIARPALGTSAEELNSGQPGLTPTEPRNVSEVLDIDLADEEAPSAL
jgi:hypothetical protein